MTRMPTAANVDRKIEALATVSRLSTKGGVRRRLVDALRREAKHGTTIPDGMPASTLGDGMPGIGHPELTATEAAAVGRLRPPADEHRQLTLRAWDALCDAVDNVNTLLAALADLDAMRGPHAEVTEPCDACGPHRERLAPIHRRGTVGDRLTAPVKLCKACYQFVSRVAGRMPTAAEVRHHETTGRWPR